MKTTSSDAVGLTVDLHACSIETKEDRPAQRDLERLLLCLARGPQSTISDEQVLSLP